MYVVKVLDAVSLEERFKKALPMLTRQIEGLKLLQKTIKVNPDHEKRVTRNCVSPFFFQNDLYILVCLRLLLRSVQVLSVRKGRMFPGRQFNVDEEDDDEDGDDTATLEKKVHRANMPESALRVCLKELKRWSSYLQRDLYYTIQSFVSTNP